MIALDIIDIGEIMGAVYYKFIQWAFQKSDSVMLLYQYGSGEVENKKLDMIRTRLKKYCIKTIEGADEWPGTQSDKDPHRIIGYYACCLEVLSVFFEVDNIKAWSFLEDRPFDLSFFKDHVCWCYTTFMEDWCIMNGEDIENELFLKSYGINYRKIEHSEFFREHES